MVKEVNLEEVKRILKCFEINKSPCLEGWLDEFFLTSFDILGKELLEIVEFWRKEKFMSGAMNANFLTLIPKKENTASFRNFRPISLYFIMQFGL